MKKCPICKIAALLAGIGALNWGLVALFNFNLVTRFLGDATTATKAAYIVVGISGLMVLLSFFNLCPCQKNCATK